jgi:hypothetical protein
MVDKVSVALWIGFAVAVIGFVVVIVLRILKNRKNPENLKVDDKVHITFPVTMALFGGTAPGKGRDTGTKVDVTLYGTVATAPTLDGKVNVTWTSLKSSGAGQKAIKQGATPPTGWNTHMCTLDRRNFLAARAWPQSVGIYATRLTKGESTTVSGQTESMQGVFDTYQIGSSGCSMSGDPSASSLDAPFITEEAMLQKQGCTTGHPMRHAASNWGMALAGQERMTPSGCNQGLITVSDDRNDGCYPVEWAEKPLKTGSQIKYRNIPQSTYWEASRNLGALPAYTLAL